MLVDKIVKDTTRVELTDLTPSTKYTFSVTSMNPVKGGTSTVSDTTLVFVRMDVEMVELLDELSKHNRFRYGIVPAAKNIADLVGKVTR